MYMTNKPPEEILKEAKIAKMELEFLLKMSAVHSWDISGEVDATGCMNRSIRVIEDLCREVGRMKDCLHQIDEEASKWHESISKSVCNGAFPQHFK